MSIGVRKHFLFKMKKSCFASGRSVVRLDRPWRRLARRRPAPGPVPSGGMFCMSPIRPGHGPVPSPVWTGWSGLWPGRTGSHARRPGPWPGFGPVDQAARKTPRSTPNGHISFGYKRGFFPNGFLGFLSIFLTTIVEPLELASSPFPPLILAYSWGI